MNKKILGVVIILVIFLIIVLVGIIMLRKSNNEEEFVENEDLTIVYSEVPELLVDNQAFFSLETLVQKYIILLYEEDTQALTNILDKEFVSSNNLTNQNMINKLGKVLEDTVFNAEYIYLKENNEGTIYFISGNINNEINYYVKILVDDATAAYSLKPITEQEFENAKNGKFDNVNINVELNKDNQMEYIIVSEKTLLGKYFTKYRELCRNDAEKAYELLNETYRNKRFKNLSGFKKYINDIYTELDEMYPISYRKEAYEGFIDYICSDKNENIYIITETSPMQFTLVLDTHTLEQDKFNIEYDQANVQRKVMMNIDKFIKMINARDYVAAYDCLADSFKQNKFKTEKSFEDYMKINFYRYNEAVYFGFDDSVSGVYKYNVTIKNKNNEEQSKTYSVIMKLNEKRGFEISFSE